MPLRNVSFAIMICVLVSATAAAEQKYVRPRLLLEPAELARPRVSQRFVILDARKKEAYEEEHVPGAHWVDHDKWKSDFGDGTDVEGWSQRIGDMGIDADSSVVVYDDISTKNAARIWWILRYWGVRDVRLLNGGWKAWKAEGFPASSDAAASPTVVAFKATPRKKTLVTKNQILDSLADRDLQIIDVRSEDEFCGIEVKESKRGGAIPGAKHLEWSNLIDPATDRFKSAEELRQLFDKAGIDLDKPSASHCQSGGRASVMVFGMELMGAKNSGNYFPGWSEWGNNDDLPIVVPKKE